MKIITLIENLVYKKGLTAEHGLSMYIETPDKKILFDTGQSGLFLENAKKLGVEIESIDTVVLSHGHYDHTGGLYHFLEKNSNAKVYAKREVFEGKYHDLNRFIGIKYDEERLMGRVVYIDSPTEIDKGLFLMPEIKIHHPVDTNFRGFFVKRGGKSIPDEFVDELYVAALHDDQISIITACSHRGITNIISSADEHFNLRVNMVLGGFHMKDCSTPQYSHITDHLRRLQPGSIGVCHCTGVDKFADIKNEINTRIFYNHTGNEIKL